MIPNDIEVYKVLFSIFSLVKSKGIQRNYRKGASKEDQYGCKNRSKWRISMPHMQENGQIYGIWITSMYNHQKVSWKSGQK